MVGKMSKDPRDIKYILKYIFKLHEMLKDILDFFLLI